MSEILLPPRKGRTQPRRWRIRRRLIAPKWRAVVNRMVAAHIMWDSGDVEHGVVGPDGALNSVTRSFGKFGRQATFDGASSFIDVPDSLGSFDVDRGFSLFVLFRVATWDIQFQAVVAQGESDNWRLARNSNDNHLSFNILGENSGVEGATNVNDGEWHTAFGTQFGQAGRLYIDGILDGTAALDPPTSSEMGGYEIGRNPQQTARVFEGDIAAVYVFNDGFRDEEVGLIQQLDDDPLAPWRQARRVFVSDAGGGTPVSQSKAVATESLAGAAVTHDARTESLSGLQKAQLVTSEYLSTTTRAKQDPTEALGGVADTKQSPTEALESIARARGVSTEVVAALIRAFQVHSENLAQVSDSVLTPSEYLASLVASGVSPTEALQGVEDSKAVPTEVLSELATVSRAVLVPTEVIGAIVASGQVPVEVLASVALGKAVPTELLRGLQQTDPVTTELLEGLAASKLVPTEALGLAAVSRGVTVPTEVLGTVLATGQVPTEFLAALSQQTGVPTEILLGGIVRSVQVEAEALEGIAQAVGVPTEVLQIIATLFADPSNVLRPLNRPRILGPLGRARILGSLNRPRIFGRD